MTRVQYHPFPIQAVKSPMASLLVTIVASLLSIFVFLGAVFFLYLQSSSSENRGQMFGELFKTQQTRQEWQKDRGSPEGSGSVNDPAETGRHDVALMP